MPLSNYCLPADYSANPIIQYDGHGYWTPGLIESASYYQWPVYQYAARLIRRHAFGSLCDVGCGVGIKLGRLHRKFPRLRIIGMDQHDPITYCRDHFPFGEWHELDLNHPPSGLVPISSFVICADVIEHVEDPDVLINILRKLTSPGGLVLISTPDRERMSPDNRKGPPGSPFHVREWSKEEFGSYLTKSGFRILRHFHTFPVRFALNRIWWDEVAWRWRQFRSAKYNQVALLEA